MESPVTADHETPEQMSARDADTDADAASGAPVAEITPEVDGPTDPINQIDPIEQVAQIQQVEQVESVERQMSFDEVEDSRVRAALERLADLDGLPIAEQVEVFADIHARLADALGASATADADRDPSTGS